MSIQEQIDELVKTISGNPTRHNISTFIDITKDCSDAEFHEYLVNFLDFYPNSKDKVINDLYSYSNYER